MSFSLLKELKLGVVVFTCNPALSQEDREFEACVS